MSHDLTRNEMIALFLLVNAHSLVEKGMVIVTGPSLAPVLPSGRAIFEEIKDQISYDDLDVQAMYENMNHIHGFKLTELGEKANRAAG